MTKGVPRYTYCDGPTYKIHDKLTRKDIILVIDALNEIFGQGWNFQLEPITEGGIEVVQWPGKPKHAFKTLRFIHDKIQWPWITSLSAAEWRESDKVVLEGCVFDTYLKAFFGAPCWSVRELEKWNRAWARVGVTVVKKTLYPKHKYISYGGYLAAMKPMVGKASQKATPVRKRFRDGCIKIK